MNTAICVKDLSYAYKKQVVIHNIRFEVPIGSFFILIGPNGSGKTTLMKLISGIEKLQAGQLEILAKPIQHYARRDLAKTLGFVPQTMPVDFPFTVMEVVLMGRSPHMGILGLEQAQDLETVESAMEFTGIKDLAHRQLNQLSGGERQRVFIAKAIAQEPKIILLDEPTSALDLAHQINIMDLMEKLKTEKGLTIVMVSHDVNLAAMYADQLLLLKNGEIVTQGIPHAVLNSQILEHTYGCRLMVDESPFGKFPRITLMPQRAVTDQ